MNIHKTFTAIREHLATLPNDLDRYNYLSNYIIDYQKSGNLNTFLSEFQRKQGIMPLIDLCRLELDRLKTNLQVNSDKNHVINQPTSYIFSSHEKNQKLTFADIFIESDWRKYVEALQKCQPKLLDSQFRFIGNRNKHRGVIAAWFKHLKAKGIIDQTINREILATILSSELTDYSISPSSIDNESEEYLSIFESQLHKLTGLD